MRGDRRVLRVGIEDLGEPITLGPFEADHKVQWDIRTGARKPAVSVELAAYNGLVAEYRRSGQRELPIRITGPLTKTRRRWKIQVREFEVRR